MIDRQEVFVEASARLHFGVLDLRGAQGRWFGGIGAAAPGPTLLVSGTPADALETEGQDAERAAEYARRFMAYHRVEGGVRLHVHRALPQHSGLGSGTQLALAVSRAPRSSSQVMNSTMPQAGRLTRIGTPATFGAVSSNP